jgi:hypothetical protein
MQGMNNIERTSYFYILILVGFWWEDMTVFWGFYTIIYLYRGADSIFEKLTGSQLVKKFLAFYGTRLFIAAFTSARHVPFPEDLS